MLRNYRRHRRDLARLYRLRDIGNALTRVTDEVMVLDEQTNQYTRDKINELRIREEELISSAIDDIPWYCKVVRP